MSRKAVAHHPKFGTVEATMSAWEASLEAAEEDVIVMRRPFDEDEEENFDSEGFGFDDDDDEDADDDDEDFEDDEEEAEDEDFGSDFT
ncbi:MAG: hypothetical protein V4503_04090, partial [Gemmatimonadota bacterium]